MFGQNGPPAKVDLSVVIQQRLTVEILGHELFLREMNSFKQAKTRIAELQSILSL